MSEMRANLQHAQGKTSLQRPLFTDGRPKSFGAVPQYGHVEVVEVVDVVVVIIGGGSCTGTGKAGCGGGLVVVMVNYD